MKTRAAGSASDECEAATAISTTMTTITRNVIATPTNPEETRLPRLSGSRPIAKRESPRRRTRARPRAPQAPSDQPATANTGRAASTSSAPAAAGSRRPGTGRGVVSACLIIRVKYPR